MYFIRNIKHFLFLKIETNISSFMRKPESWHDT